MGTDGDVVETTAPDRLIVSCHGTFLFPFSLSRAPIMPLLSL
jgi:hypothetical protein